MLVALAAATEIAPPPRRRLERRRTVGWAAALVLGTLTVLTCRWFVWPDTDPPAQVDAIVMYGGSGNRFDLARNLAQSGYAETVVLSDPKDPAEQYTAYGGFCAQDHSYEALCFDPVPRTTRGESRFVADLARERGWNRILLVTDTEQATRAKMLLERCWSGDVDVVTVNAGISSLVRVAYEWAAWTRAQVTRRAC